MESGGRRAGRGGRAAHPRQRAQSDQGAAHSGNPPASPLRSKQDQPAIPQGPGRGRRLRIPAALPRRRAQDGPLHAAVLIRNGDVPGGHPHPPDRDSARARSGKSHRGTNRRVAQAADPARRPVRDARAADRAWAENLSSDRAAMRRVSVAQDVPDGAGEAIFVSPQPEGERFSCFRTEKALPFGSRRNGEILVERHSGCFSPGGSSGSGSCSTKSWASRPRKN